MTDAGEFKKCTAEDGHTFEIYVSRPPVSQTTSKKGLVIVQEAFGVNSYIRSVADEYAKEGYVCVAPLMFDRIAPGERREYAYDGESLKEALAALTSLYPFDKSMLDCKAAATYLTQTEQCNEVGLVGFCFGGAMAMMCAAQLAEVFKVTVGYYGLIRDEKALAAADLTKCPTMYHFGELDQHLTKEMTSNIQKYHPHVPVYYYANADHGFSCHARSQYHPESAQLAARRTKEFLHQHFTQ